MDETAFDSNLMARYLVGECSPAEGEVVRRWIEQDEQLQRETDVMARAWDIAGALPSGALVDQMWNHVAGELELRTGSEPARRFAMLPAPASAWRRYWRIAAAAAAVVAIVGGGIAFLRHDGRRDGLASEVPQHGGQQEFRTSRGQRSVMRLLDGTAVVLGPESRLVVHGMASGPRELELEGEALFDVVHDERRPFRVRAGRAITEDLGTRFGIRAYGHDPVRVVVSEGAVAVRDTAGSDAVMLAPRELVQVDATGRMDVQRGVDPREFLAWADGRLVFRRMPLADVIVQLERWFGVEIIASDSSLLRTKVTATFNDDDLDQVLRTLAEALDVRVDRRSRWIYLRAAS